MKARLPKGLVGALFGALGMLPLLPIASGLAIRFSSLPSLPGAERRLADFKQATYAEAVVLVLVLPLAALFFGWLLPKLLARLAARGTLSFEWVGAGFALSFFLAHRGIRPKHALLAGLAAAAAVAAGILAFRASFRFRRLFTRRNRGALLSLALAGASLGLARRTGLTPRPLVGNLLVELALAAIALTLAAGFLSLLLTRRRDELLRRLARAAPLSVAASAAAILFPRLSAPLLAAGLAGLFIVGFLAPAGRATRAPLCGALFLLLLACGWGILRVPVSRIELFEDGVSLAYAESYLHGARPYQDTYPLHGWGADGGVDTFFFHIFGPTLRVFQLRQAAWSVAALALLAGACFGGLRSGLWGALALLLCLSLCPLPFERQAPAFAALLFLLWGARTKKAVPLFLAGAFAAWTLFHSLEYGTIVLLGGLAGLLLLTPLESGLSTLRPDFGMSGRFLAGALLGALPFLVLLATKGSLSGFLRISFVEIPLWIDPVWGLPAGRAWDSLLHARNLPLLARLIGGEVMSSFFLLVLLAVVLTVLLLRSSAGRFDEDDRVGWVGLVVALFALRCVLGRADEPHLARYGVFAGVPAAWLLLRAWRAGPAHPALLLSAAALVFVRLDPMRTLETELSWVEHAARRDQASVGAPAPRSGGAMLPTEQALELSAFRQYVDERLAPGETFFDFSNQPGLYFVADRLLPIRFHTVALYESEEKQGEVLTDLERKKPPIAILPFGLYGALDGVSNHERAPLVARYLAENYVLDRPVAGWPLAKRKRPGTVAGGAAASAGEILASPGR